MHAVPTSTQPSSTTRQTVLLAGLCVLAVPLLVLGNGNPVFALAPLALWGGVVLLLRQSVRTLFLGALALALFVDYVPESPYEHRWQPPWFMLSRLVFDLLQNVTGVSALRAQGMDLIVLGLLGLRIYRRTTHSTLDAPPTPVSHVIAPFVVLSIAGVFFGVLKGAVTGGNMKEALWQVHQLLIWPLVAVLAAQTLRGSKDLAVLGRIVVAAGIFKALVSTYFIYRIVRPNGLLVEFAPSHSDTLVYVTGVLVLLLRLAEQPSGRRLLRTLLPLALLFWGLHLNDRRLAYASLGFSLLAAFLLMRPKNTVRRWAIRLIVISLPIIPPYMAAGWGKQGGIWGPVAMVRGMLVGEQEGHADYRDIENHNVLQGWIRNPITGSGWGHEILLVAPMPDISAAMPSWRYHPHNQLLWLWTCLGLVGWSLVWPFLVVVMFLAVRTYRLAEDPQVRTACLVAVGFFLTWGNQVFGDMGTKSWYGALMLAVVVVMVGQLAWEHHAWPRRRPRAVPEPEPSAEPLT